MTDWTVLHTRYGEKMSLEEARRRFYELEQICFEIIWKCDTHKNEKNTIALSEENYVILARSYEALLPLSLNPIVLAESSYAQSEDLPREKTMRERILKTQIFVEGFLSRTHRKARPLLMGRPESYENIIRPQE